MGGDGLPYEVGNDGVPAAGIGSRGELEPDLLSLCMVGLGPTLGGSEIESIGGYRFGRKRILEW